MAYQTAARYHQRAPHAPLGAVFGLSCYMADDSPAYAIARQSGAAWPKTFVRHGSADDFIRPEWGRRTFDRLKATGSDRRPTMGVVLPRKLLPGERAETRLRRRPQASTRISTSSPEPATRWSPARSASSSTSWAGTSWMGATCSSFAARAAAATADGVASPSTAASSSSSRRGRARRRARHAERRRDCAIRDRRRAVQGPPVDTPRRARVRVSEPLRGRMWRTCFEGPRRFPRGPAATPRCHPRGR